MTLPPGELPRPVVPHQPAAVQPTAPAAFDFGLGDGSQYRADAVADGPLRDRHRRRPSVDGRSVAVPLAITLVTAAIIGGGVLTGWALVQKSEADVKADSAEFCAALAETPGVLSQPAFGWPTSGADMASTLALMEEYQARWEAIAAVAPATIEPDTKAVADSAAAVTQGIVASKTIDRQASLAAMESVTSKTDIPAWAAKYC